MKVKFEKYKTNVSLNYNKNTIEIEEYYALKVNDGLAYYSSERAFSLLPGILSLFESYIDEAGVPGFSSVSRKDDSIVIKCSLLVNERAMADFSYNSNDIDDFVKFKIAIKDVIKKCEEDIRTALTIEKLMRKREKKE